MNFNISVNPTLLDLIKMVTTHEKNEFVKQTAIDIFDKNYTTESNEPLTNLYDYNNYYMSIIDVNSVKSVSFIFKPADTKTCIVNTFSNEPNGQIHIERNVITIDYAFDSKMKYYANNAKNYLIDKATFIEAMNISNEILYGVDIDLISITGFVKDTENQSITVEKFNSSIKFTDYILNDDFCVGMIGNFGEPHSKLIKLKKSRTNATHKFELVNKNDFIKFKKDVDSTIKSSLDNLFANRSTINSKLGDIFKNHYIRVINDIKLGIYVDN